MDVNMLGEIRDWLALILIIVIFIKVVLRRSMPNDVGTTPPGDAPSMPNDTGTTPPGAASSMPNDSGTNPPP